MMTSARDDILARLRAAGVSNPEERIHRGMTVQELVRILETHEARVNNVEPRWQFEMRSSEKWPGITRSSRGPL